MTITTIILAGIMSIKKNDIVSVNKIHIENNI